MDLITESYTELFPEVDFPYQASIKYSGKFRGYNANVKLRGKVLTFNLAKNWRGVDRDIKKGLLQELLGKMFKSKLRGRPAKTMSMDMYNIFIKKVHLTAPKTDLDPYLDESFQRMNERYFAGNMERPNLRFGKNSIRQLGLYEYGTDTITISRILEDAPLDILDYVMYHEMLHKKHKYDHNTSRNHHHTKAFREEEALYHLKDAEDHLNNFLRFKTSKSLKKDSTVWKKLRELF